MKDRFFALLILWLPRCLEKKTFERVYGPFKKRKTLVAVILVGNRKCLCGGLPVTGVPTARGMQEIRVQIAIVVYQGMTALDAVGPYEVFRFVPDVEIRFVGHKPGPVVTDSGVLVLGATHSLSETPGPDIVLVPGSSADTTTAMADGKLLNWLQAVNETSRLTLSVCSGALILAAAGLLEGHPATTHWVAQKGLKRFGVEPRKNDRIVKSGKLITAAGVSAGIDLALSVVEDLYGRDRAEITQLLIEYDPMPPVDSGHPSKASEAVYKAARAEMLAEAKNPRNVVSVPVILWRRALQQVRRKIGVK